MENNLDQAIKQISSLLNSNTSSESKGNTLSNDSLLSMLSSISSAPTRNTSSQTDPRVKLLDALIPFVGPEKKEKIETAKQMLKLSNITNLFGN